MTVKRGPFGRVRALSCCLLAGVVVTALLATAPPASASPPTGPNAVVTDSGCSTSNMGANDDNSVGPISLAFSVDWFGTTYSQLWINNNGGVDLQQAWSSFSGLDLGSIRQPVIAPLFTDIDTRTSGATPVSYGTITYDGHQAFCVDWVNVGHYSRGGPYYSAQLLLVDRSDTGAGNVDAIFNYDWVGTASYELTAGYAAADGTYYQFTGSQTTPSPLADGGDDALTAGTLNSGGQLGRYTFPVRGGLPPQSQTINFPNPGSALTTQTSVALDATATSGLPVTYTATGVCTISGGAAMLTGSVGTCAVTAHQPGDSTASPVWLAAPDVEQDFTVTAPPVAVATTELPSGGVGAAYTASVEPQGGVAPYTWSVTAGALPPGVTLDPATGALSGVPATPGAFTFTVQVEDSTTGTATATFTVEINPSGLNARPIATTPDGRGYWVATPDGGVFAFGDATFHGSLSGHTASSPIVGIAATPDGAGYWLVTVDGGVFSFGDAPFYGSGTGRTEMSIVGIATTSDGHGYWLVASDGGVFAFGDATFHGSLIGTRLAAPVLGMAATADNGGYWLVARDGGVFAFGDAIFRGSLGARSIASPVVGMAATSDERGYWLVSADGGIFAFGDAPFEGSARALPLNQPMTGIAATDDDRGYWLVAGDGGVFAYGDAGFVGSRPGVD